jgi:MerR family mercuric resistance operon transcriptional regulator
MQKLTIGRLAEASGVHLETIRYYERIGLIREPERTAGGHRLYTAPDLARLRFIRCSRELGFGIEAIQHLLRLSEPGSGTCGEARALAQAHVTAIQGRIDQLLFMKETLLRVMEGCPADASPTDACPILDYMSACGATCQTQVQSGLPSKRSPSSDLRMAGSCCSPY